MHASRLPYTIPHIPNLCYNQSRFHYTFHHAFHHASVIFPWRSHGGFPLRYGSHCDGSCFLSRFHQVSIALYFRNDRPRLWVTVCRRKDSVWLTMCGWRYVCESAWATVCALHRYITVMRYASALQCVMVMVTVVRYGALRWCVMVECYNDELRCVTVVCYGAYRWCVMAVRNGTCRCQCFTQG